MTQPRKPSASRSVAVRATDGFEYEAFISYRHVDPDRRIAVWLHSALESFRVPKRLVEDRGVPPRIKRVFRDEEELSASSDLGQELEDALRKSRFLIVICSPRTPESEWVSEEVKRFREWGRDGRILALLIEGEPRESFPRPLREIRRTIVDETGQQYEAIEEVEPLAADVRPRHNEKGGHIRRMAKLRILACLLGCKFDHLRQREQERQARRLIWAGAFFGLLALLLAGLSVVAVVQKRRADVQTEQANYQKRQAELREEGERAAKIEEEKAKIRERDARKGTRGHLHTVSMALAQRASEDGASGRLKDLLLSTVPKDDEEDLRGFEWYYLWRQRYPSRSVLATGSSGLGAMSPDGKTLATVAGDRRTVDLWDVATRRKQASLTEHTGQVLCLAFTPDGKTLASGGFDKTVRLWDVAIGRQRAALVATFAIWAVAFSPDSNTVAAGSQGANVVSLWDATTAKASTTFNLGANSNCNSLAFSSDGKLLAIGGYRSTQRDRVGLLEIWDAAGEKRLQVLPCEHPVKCLAFAPGSRTLATAGGSDAASREASELKLWDADTAQVRVIFPPQERVVTHVTFSPDGKSLASSDGYYAIKLWDPRSGQLSGVLHSDDEKSWLAFGSNGKTLASGKAVVTSWDLSPHPDRISMQTDEGRALMKSFSTVAADKVLSPDGKVLATAQPGGSVQLWDPATGKETGKVGFQRDVFYIGNLGAIALCPDGRTAATWGPSFSYALLQDRDATQARVLEGHTGKVTALTFAPNGRTVATGSADRTVKLWDVVTGQERATYRGPTAPVEAVAFTADGRTLLAASSDGIITRWRAATNAEVDSAKVTTNWGFVRGGK